MNIANERPSMKLPPVTDRRQYVWKDGTRGIECSVGPYDVCARWDWLGAEPKASPGNGYEYAMLQICRADGGSVVDWRDLQQIKNAVCGPEWEAVEIFPAESRLKDPSNARYLWCCANSLPFGLPGGRLVLDASEAFAPQRSFAEPNP